MFVSITGTRLKPPAMDGMLSVQIGMRPYANCNSTHSQSSITHCSNFVPPRGHCPKTDRCCSKAAQRFESCSFSEVVLFLLNMGGSLISFCWFLFFVLCLIDLRCLICCDIGCCACQPAMLLEHIICLLKLRWHSSTPPAPLHGLLSLVPFHIAWNMPRLTWPTMLHPRCTMRS